MDNIREGMASDVSSSSSDVDDSREDSSLNTTFELFIKYFSLAERVKLPAFLYIAGLHFNCARVNRLTDFLCSGVKNCYGRSMVKELWIKGCTFENEEVLRLMCDFFDSNKAPKTLESVNCFGGLTEQIYESLLPSLHDNKTITELFLWLDEENDSGISGELVGNLLQRNTTLTRLRLGGRFVTVEFIRAMRNGLLASRSRLQSLRLHNAQLGHKALDELRLVYENNHGQESVILRELDLSGNAIEGRDGGDHLRRLLLTLPGLTTLDISKNEINEQGATALFADGMTDVLGRLQRLCMRGCVIGNVGLTQMAASVPGNALLVDLDLSGKNLEDNGGNDDSLCRLFRCCVTLESLKAYRNGTFGVISARYLAQGIANLPCMHTLNLGYCDIRDGAMGILNSLATSSARLRHLRLEYNCLPFTTLVSLTQFLNGPGGSLEEVFLQGNEDLFGTANVVQHGLFFDAIANHTAVQHLDIRECGLEEDGPWQSAVLKNTSLVAVNDGNAASIRRGKLMELIQSTMTSPINVPFTLWATALGVCTPRLNQVGAAPTFCLVQKMAEMDVFDFHRKKSSGLILRWWRQCKTERACPPRSQRGWKRKRPSSCSEAILFQGMRRRAACLQRENAALRQQVASLLVAAQQAPIISTSL